MTTPSTPGAALPAKTEQKPVFWLLIGVSSCFMMALQWVFTIGMIAFYSVLILNLNFEEWTNSGAPWSGIEVVLKAQGMDGKIPSEEMLQETVKILEERAENLNVARYKFTVSGPGKITARLPKGDKFDEQLAAIIQVGQVEFVDLGDISMAEGAIVITDLDPSAAAPAGAESQEVFHTIMTSEPVSEVSVITTDSGGYAVSVDLNDEGKQIFAEHTRKNVGKILAIVQDHRVVSAPRINAEIPEGSVIVEGSFTEESANALAAALRSKALPVKLKVVRQREY